jgi:hypothetical protein
MARVDEEMPTTSLVGIEPLAGGTEELCSLDDSRRSCSSIKNLIPNLFGSVNISIGMANLWRISL